MMRQPHRWKYPVSVAMAVLAGLLVSATAQAIADAPLAQLSQLNVDAASDLVPVSSQPFTSGQAFGMAPAHLTGKTYTISYTISFNAKGGSAPKIGGDVTKSKSVTLGKAYGTLPTTTKTGYTFKGWWTKASGGTRIYSTSKVRITATQTLYAHWAAKKYTIHFDANKGSTPKVGSKVTKSKSVTYTKTYGTLPVSVLKGFTLLGWYTDPIGGSKISSSTKVKPQNLTLHAHWWANSYTVKFDPNSGKMPAASKTVTYGKQYGSQPTPTRTGYVFGGWYTKASGGALVEPITKVGITATQTLYAHWLKAPAEAPVIAPPVPQYDYGVFIGLNSDQAWRLYDYSTVVIDAEYFQQADIETLKNAGIRVYSYLNIGSIETFRAVYQQFKKDTLGKYDNWPGEYWMNVANTDWQAYIDTAARALVAKGVDGFFVDNTDVYYQFKTQLIFDGLVTILNNLSALGKDVIINGGDVFVKAAVLNPAIPKVSITGVNQETVFSGINFKNDTLITQDAGDTAYYKAYLDRVASAGLEVILLEYVKTSNVNLRVKIDTYSQAKGYTYYIATTIALDR